MASSVRGANEEMVQAAGVGPPAPETPSVGGEAGPRDRGALLRGVAKESCMPNATLGGTREEASDHLSLPALPLPAVNCRVEGKKRREELSGPRAGGV